MIIIETDVLSGLYGFDVRGFSGWPNIQIHYWSDVLEVLRKKVGVEVIVTRAPSCVCYLELFPSNSPSPTVQVQYKNGLRKCMNF
jgi:hypothetical protein